MLYSYTIKLVRFYEGADGLKTGFTDNAKYCMAVTAKRNNMRLIAIVLGEDNGKTRNNETMELLDYGFNLYKVDLVKDKNDIVGYIELDKAQKDRVNVYPKEDIAIIGKKSDASINYEIELKLDNIVLPLKKNTNVGKIYIKNGNNTIKTVDAEVRETIEKIGLPKLFLKRFKDMITGSFL